MAKIGNIPLTMPNILSLYRILAFPVILTMLIIQNQTLFTWLLCINLITDILDGMLARMLKQVSEIGAKLDSIADNGTYIAAFSGIFIFKSVEMAPFFIPFIIMLALFLAAEFLALIKFGKFPSMHLYSWKVGGYLQGIFFFFLFTFGISPWYFWLMWTWSVIAFTEHIIIQIMSDSLISNAKGLYWIIRDKNSKKEF
jgi:cardiolipin synthase (CMP-forming)